MNVDELTKVDVDDATVAVVIPTLNGAATIGRLLLSLRPQARLVAEVVIVLQDPTVDLTELIASCDWTTPRVIRSQPGLSAARNLGLKSLSGTAPVVMFLDDDVWLADNALTEVLASFSPGVDAVCGALLRNDGTTRVPAQVDGSVLNSKQVWRQSIEAATFYRRDALLRFEGPFDPTLGLGASSPWSSGEGTDLLLRIMESGGTVIVNSTILMFEDAPELVDREAAGARKRAYARGTGRVYRMRYGLAGRARLVVRSLGALCLAAWRGRSAFALEYQVMVGRLEGLGAIRFRNG